MDKVAGLSAKQRNELFEASASRRRLPPAIIEKDFWVCWLLKKLFNAPELKGKLVFKGGTSLSKVHGLIDRFSEDIDLVLAWGLIGYGDEGGTDPWQELPSGTQQNRFNDEFNNKAARYIREALCPLVETITSSVSGIRCIIPDDPHVIEVHYPAAFSSSAFMPEVKLEIGPLASWVPQGDHIVRPYAAEDFPQVFDDPDCPIVAITAERTFWEKATILHQQAHRAKGKRMPPRYSRHYYDLFQMKNSSVAANAIADLSLLRDVVKFKQRFYRSPWASYETAKPGTFKLMPSEAGEIELRKDYAAMRPMFFSDPPDWDEVLRGLQDLEDRINTVRTE
ncbi:hypothetical protein LF1_27730 [Rubripirellula obstinata]|uniref:Nucleotidyl transferase AbiEii/AbiGii toxin family protein n=1 Tax=Rubripirellula obstinata TaxID=406547 RepID=A0A5B1CLL1_9BACT|nr:nucleotidyl transferase AbiEii/AbiGii toxin family protein [Rubripirellula obstinata]KAA1260234.1 hypothetical protein LF1_27730 [Rubripirellula obstinata]